MSVASPPFALVRFLGFIYYYRLESVGTGALLLHPLVLPVRNRPSVTLGASFRYFRSSIAFLGDRRLFWVATVA